MRLMENNVAPCWDDHDTKIKELKVRFKEMFAVAFFNQTCKVSGDNYEKNKSGLGALLQRG